MAQLNMGTAMSLTGQIALVTGGGTGIYVTSSCNCSSSLIRLYRGFMIAQGLAANGAKVYITGRREDTLKQAAASVQNVSGSLVP